MSCFVVGIPLLVLLLVGHPPVATAPTTPKLHGDMVVARTSETGSSQLDARRSCHSGETTRLYLVVDVLGNMHPSI